MDLFTRIAKNNYRKRGYGASGYWADEQEALRELEGTCNDVEPEEPKTVSGAAQELSTACKTLYSTFMHESGLDKQIHRLLDALAGRLKR